MESAKRLLSTDGRGLLFFHLLLICVFLLTEHCFALRAGVIHGARKGCRGRMSIIRYRYSHFCVRLREGRPPKQYYPGLQTGDQKLKEYLQNLRNRTVFRSL